MKNSKYIAAWMLFCSCISTLFAATYGGGSGTAADPYLISTPAQLNTIGLNSGDWGKCFQLTADIDMSAYTGTQYNIIGPNSNAPFHGTFDGRGHIIGNLTYNSPTTLVPYAGVFGCISQGEIRNVGLENVNINILGTSVGSLAGEHRRGTITNCYSTGSVTNAYVSVSVYTGGLVGGNSDLGTITSCYSTCSVSGSSGIGGLAGGSTGTITFCYAAGTVTGTGDSIGGLVGYYPGFYLVSTIDSCYATGTVTGKNYVGGLVGNCVNGGTMTSCYTTGAVTGTNFIGGLAGIASTVTSCHAAGTVGGVSYVGGLVGYHNSGTMTLSYAIGAVSGNLSVGGLVGRNFSTTNYCYATGSVTGTGTSDSIGGLVGYNRQTITSCYSAGAVSGASSVGGFCGSSTGGAITNCFWDTQSSGQPTSWGGTGKTTTQMKTLSTFTDAGWDFTNETANGTNNIWRMCIDGVNYPRLNRQSAPGDLTCPNGVTMDDLSWLSQNWLLTTCTADNNDCGQADINTSGSVDIEDFAIFAHHWLE